LGCLGVALTGALPAEIRVRLHAELSDFPTRDIDRDVRVTDHPLPQRRDIWVLCLLGKVSFQTLFPSPDASHLRLKLPIGSCRARGPLTIEVRNVSRRLTADPSESRLAQNRIPRQTERQSSEPARVRLIALRQVLLFFPLARQTGEQPA